MLREVEENSIRIHRTNTKNRETWNRM